MTRAFGLWAPTGWRASARGGEAIQYTLELMAGVSARLSRERPGRPWSYHIDGDNLRDPDNLYDWKARWVGAFKTPREAATACERALVSTLRGVIKTIQRGESK